MSGDDESGAPSPATRHGTTQTPADAWSDLRRHTAARIALGRSGASLPTREQLSFDLAHAQARDAVEMPLDTVALRRQLEADGWRVLEVWSRASDRAAYLARPDWGRRLHPASAEALSAGGGGTAGIVFVLSDGLSPVAVQRHAAPLLQELRGLMPDLAGCPMVIARQARVALADEVGGILRASIAVSIIGERPGLSSPDSLGIYLTWTPRVGRNDSERNCISNVRPQGLGYAEAAAQLVALVRCAFSSRLSGVALRFDPMALPGTRGGN